MKFGPIRALITLVLLLSSVPSYAHKIVLLTSLDPQENRPPLRFQSWNINEKLERRFRKEHKKLPGKINLEVIHFARANELYKTLRDEDTVAVIWVGHAGFGDSQGLSSQRSIIDFQGRDLKSIFQAIGPHLKYLALVGCRGKLFLDEWKEKGFLDHVPSLLTYGREVRTDARKGLRLAMDNLKKLIENNPELLKGRQSKEEATKKQFYQENSSNLKNITLIRKNLESKSMSSVQILQKDRLIGFLPESQSDQEISIYLNKADKSSDLKIINESGAPSSEVNVNLGSLVIESVDNEEWQIFQTSAGKPIGVGKHIYRYKNLERR